MIRKTLLALALVAAPALAQQPAQQPAAAKPPRTMTAQRADTTKAKAHRMRRGARSKAKPAKPAAPAAPRDSTTKP